MHLLAGRLKQWFSAAGFAPADAPAASVGSTAAVSSSLGAAAGRRGRGAVASKGVATATAAATAAAATPASNVDWQEVLTPALALLAAIDDGAAQGASAEVTDEAATAAAAALREPALLLASGAAAAASGADYDWEGFATDTAVPFDVLTLQPELELLCTGGPGGLCACTPAGVAALGAAACEAPHLPRDRATRS